MAISQTPPGPPGVGPEKGSSGTASTTTLASTSPAQPTPVAPTPKAPAADKNPQAAVPASPPKQRELTRGELHDLIYKFERRLLPDDGAELRDRLLRGNLTDQQVANINAKLQKNEQYKQDIAGWKKQLAKAEDSKQSAATVAPPQGAAASAGSPQSQATLRAVSAAPSTPTLVTAVAAPKPGIAIAPTQSPAKPEVKAPKADAQAKSASPETTAVSGATAGAAVAAPPKLFKREGISPTIWYAGRVAKKRIAAMGKNEEYIGKLRAQAANADTAEARAKKLYQVKIQENLRARYQAESESAIAKHNNKVIDKARNKELSQYKAPSGATPEQKQQIEGDKQRAQEIYSRAKALRDQARIDHKQATKDYVKIQIAMVPKPGEDGPHWGIRPFRMKMKQGAIHSQETKINQLQRKAESAKVDQAILQELTRSAKVHPISQAERLDQAITHFEAAKAIRDSIEKEVRIAESKDHNAKFGIISKRRLTDVEKNDRTNKVTDSRADHKIANAIMAAAPKTPEGMEQLSKDMKAFDEVRVLRDSFREAAKKADKAAADSKITLGKSKKFQGLYSGDPDKLTRLENKQKEFNRVANIQKALRAGGSVAIIGTMPRKELGHVQALRRKESANTDYKIAQNIMNAVAGPPPDPKRLQTVKQDMDNLKDIQLAKDKLRKELEEAEKKFNKPTYTAIERISKLKTSGKQKSPARRAAEQLKVECLETDFNTVQKITETLQDQKPINSKDIERAKNVTDRLAEARKERDKILAELAVQEKKIEKFTRGMPADQAAGLKQKSEQAGKLSGEDRALFVQKSFRPKDIKYLHMQRNAEAMKTDIAILNSMMKDLGDKFKDDKSIKEFDEKLKAFKEIRAFRDKIKKQLEEAEKKMVRTMSHSVVALGREIGVPAFQKTPAQRADERRVAGDLDSAFKFTQKLLDQLKPPNKVTSENLATVKEQLKNHERARKILDETRKQLGMDEKKLEKYQEDKKNGVGLSKAEGVNEVDRKITKHSERVQDRTADYKVLQGMMRRAEANPDLLKGNAPSPIEQEMIRYKEAMKIRDKIRTQYEAANKKYYNSVGALKEYHQERVADLKSDLAFARAMMDKLTEKPPIDKGKLREFKKNMKKYQELTKIRDDLHKSANRNNHLSAFVNGLGGTLVAGQLKRRADDFKADYKVISQMIKDINNDPSKIAEARKKIRLYQQAMKARDKIREALTKAEDNANSLLVGRDKREHYRQQVKNLSSDRAAMNSMMENAPKTEEGLKALHKDIKAFKELTELRDALEQRLIRNQTRSLPYLHIGRQFQKEYKNAKIADLKVACAAMREIVNMPVPPPMTRGRIDEAQEKVKKLEEMIKQVDDLRKKVYHTKQEIVDNKKEIKNTKDSIKNLTNQIEADKKKFAKMAEKMSKLSSRDPRRLWYAARMGVLAASIGINQKRLEYNQKKLPKLELKGKQLERKLKEHEQNYENGKNILKGTNANNINSQSIQFAQTMKAANDRNVARSVLDKSEMKTFKDNQAVEKGQKNLENKQEDQKQAQNKLDRLKGELAKTQAEIQTLSAKKPRSREDSARLAKLKITEAAQKVLVNFAQRKLANATAATSKADNTLNNSATGLKAQALQSGNVSKSHEKIYSNANAQVKDVLAPSAPAAKAAQPATPTQAVAQQPASAAPAAKATTPVSAPAAPQPQQTTTVKVTQGAAAAPVPKSAAPVSAAITPKASTDQIAAPKSPAPISAPQAPQMSPDQVAQMKPAEAKATIHAAVPAAKAALDAQPMPPMKKAAAQVALKVVDKVTAPDPNKPAAASVQDASAQAASTPATPAQPAPLQAVPQAQAMQAKPLQPAPAQAVPQAAVMQPSAPATPALVQPGVAKDPLGLQQAPQGASQQQQMQVQNVNHAQMHAGGPPPKPGKAPGGILAFSSGAKQAATAQPAANDALAQKQQQIAADKQREAAESAKQAQQTANAAPKPTAKPV